MSVISGYASNLVFDFAKNRLTAGVTGKGGIWRTKPPDAESAVWGRIPKSVGNARTCPVHAVLARFHFNRSLVIEKSIKPINVIPKRAPIGVINRKNQWV
jgi:hypothetical protein